MERDYLRCLTISPSYLTDVSRYAGSHEHVFQSTTAGASAELKPSWRPEQQCI